jgi:polysaccharide deacetylase family protein (PEP-CTERM system associated)
MTSNLRILTFDIEDWFHILDNESTRDEREWQTFPARIHENTDRILNLLEQHHQQATFFCLGWIAKKYPEVIKKIAHSGHEIACHSNLHQLVYEQTPEAFHQDTASAIKTLEDITGKKVVSYRAPGFSITEQTIWAFEILLDLGIERDSSVFPAQRSHGGYSSFGTAEPAKIIINGKTLKEFPINTCNFLGRSLVYSGGGYFRMLPYFALDQLIKRDNYIMTYFHPRDFDCNQPMIPGLSLTRKFKSYVGLKSSLLKLNDLIVKYNFSDLEGADKQINWDVAKIISYE